MGIRNKVTSEIYSITSYDPLTGEITGINLTEGNTNLGNVTTVFIGGGNPGEVLSTDGTGNLSWIPDGVGYSNADVANYLPTYTGNIGNTGNVVSNMFVGNLRKADGNAFIVPLKNEWWIDPVNGNDTTGTGTSVNPYKTIAKALAVSAPDGSVYNLAAGVYTEAVTWTKINTNIVGPGTGQLADLQGLQTIAHVAPGSIRFDNVGMKNVVISSSNAATYFYDTQIQGTITKSGNGYVSFDGNDVATGPINITGAGLVQFRNSVVDIITVNNASAGASLLSCTSEIATYTLIAGSLGITGSTITGTIGSNIVTTSPGSLFISTGTFFAEPDASSGKLALGGFWSLNAVSFDAANSVITGTNIQMPSYSDAVVSYGNITAAARVTATGNVSGGNITTAGVVAATGNITASGFFKGDGGYLSNIAGANVTGEVALANTVSNPAQPNITSLGVLTSLTANSLNVSGQFTANGNAQFNADVYFAGNVTLPGNINQISGNSGTFFGNAVTGFGALYVGLPTGYTLLNNEVAQFSDNLNGYTQITHRNINGGDQATGDFVITADNGTDTTNYIDLGIAGGGYDGALSNNSLGTVLYSNDGYLYTQGNVTGGNLVLGSNQTNGVVRIIANGESNIGNVVATFGATGLTVAANVTAGNFIGDGSQLTNLPVSQDITSTGDMSIMTYDGNLKYVNKATIEPATGDIGSAGNISADGNITATGNVTAAYIIGNGSQLTNLPTPAPVIDFVASASTIAPPVGATQYNITALAESATIAAPVGTPLDGQKLTIRIIDNGTPQALTWNAIYQVIGTTLPTTTVANKFIYVGCIFNAQASKWDVVSVATQA